MFGDATVSEIKGFRLPMTAIASKAEQIASEISRVLVSGGRAKLSSMNPFGGEIAAKFEKFGFQLGADGSLKLIKP